MSANSNPESVSNQGEFHSRVPPSEPLTTKGVSPFSIPSTPLSSSRTNTPTQHAPGVKVGNDAAPSFSAETLAAGTAPSDRTFKPNTQNEIPGQAMNPNISKETWTSADSTLGGATSKDVHQGLGQPMPQGSKELHHGGSEPGKRERTGVAGRGGEADVDG